MRVEMDEDLVKALIGFHKSLENRPTLAVHWYAGIVDYLRYEMDVTVVEDCAQVFAEYIKKSSVWKQRVLAENISKLSYPAKVFILKQFTDFQIPGISIDLILSQNPGFGDESVQLFKKSKMRYPGMAFGRNEFGKFGLGAGIPEVSELTPLRFEFNLAFLGKNHAIFWKSFSGEVWACGKSANFLKRVRNGGLEIPEYYSTPIKLDYIEFKKHPPLVEMGDGYTKFINYTEEATLFIGSCAEKEKILESRVLENVEKAENWMSWTRKRDDLPPLRTSVCVDFQRKPVKVDVHGYFWKCDELGSSGKVIYYLCGKRVPKLVNISICADGSIWYRDKYTLYKGSLHFADNGRHLVASLLEVPFHFKIGGFSVAPDGQSMIIFANRKNDHVEEFHARPQVDYSIFILLTHDPWKDYVNDDIRKTIAKLDKVEQFLKDKYATCYNEYGLVCNNLETLKAIDNLYHLIKIEPGRQLPEMMLALAEYGIDRISEYVVVNEYLRRAEESETLRVHVEPGDRLLERIVAEAQRQFEHKISVIRSGLRVLKELNLPNCHEGIWTYVKYMEFIGYYENRWKISKGRFEKKEPMAACFQTRDIERIVQRRVHEQRILASEADGLKDLVQIRAVANRSDKTKMNVFYLYPLCFFVLKPFVEAMNPALLGKIDENNVLDLNSICNGDEESRRFVSMIRDVSGCEHPRDFEKYQSRISLDRIVFYHPDVYKVQTTDRMVRIPKILFRVFSILPIESDEFELDARGDLVELGMEALLDMRELLEVSTFVKYELYCFYTHALFLEASNDVMKMIVLTGKEEDVPIFRRLFDFHPIETIGFVARYRPEILILWDPLPVSIPPIPYLEKIFEFLARKCYAKREQEKNFIVSSEEVLGSRTSPEWLREHFSQLDLDTEADVVSKFKVRSINNGTKWAISKFMQKYMKE